MLETIKTLFASKKFITTVLAAAVTAGMNYAGVSPETQHWILGLFATLIGAQGLADLGKNAK